MFNYYLKLSWLSIKRTPMLTMLMVLAIGLGISVTMTVLTVNYLMSKDPIPSKSDQLFHVQLMSYGDDHYNGDSTDGYPLQLTYQDAMNIHESAIPLRKTRSLKTGFSILPEKQGMTPFLQSARAIDSDFFAMFKLKFLFGAAWESSIDSKAKQVTVLSKELNDKLFAGKDSIGKQINVGEKIFTVVGVVDTWNPSPRFYDLNDGAFHNSELLFVPFSLIPVLELPSWGNNNGWKEEQINTFQDKLASEVMWNQYWVELESEEQQDKYINWLNGYVAEQKQLGRFTSDRAGATIRNVLEWMTYNNVVSDDSNILVVLAFMFLVVCLINTIGLLLAKFLRRAPEVGVRRALGASRNQIFIQHLVDVSVIGLAGGLLGLTLGQIGLYAISIAYSNYEQLVHMDLTLIIGAIVIALGASILSGLFPAWKICQTNPSIYLKMQ
jgi:putative ABC transport system permease protein